MNYNGNFNKDNIKSVELNLLDGQIELILRSLELYSYNLEFMLDNSDSSDDLRQEKMALIKYTYENVLSAQAEQVNGKENNIENLPTLGKKLIKDGKIIDIMSNNNKLNAI